MAVLSRLLQAPAAVRIGPGVAAELPAILSDQRISGSGRFAVAISEGSGTGLREQLARSLPADVGWFTVARASLDAAVDLADRIRAEHAPYDTLVAIGGAGIVHGCNGLTEGPTDESKREAALKRAREQGFLGA